MNRKNFKHHRFIILARSRVGSTFLASLLSNHNHIKIFGELFNLNSLPKAIMAESLKDPLKYLKNRLYKVYPSRVKAVGFKIFYYHASRDSIYSDGSNNFPKDAHNDSRVRIQNFYQYVQRNFDLEGLQRKLKSIWGYLKNDSELRVIHLKRRNILKTFLSYKRAFLTNEWYQMVKTKSNQSPIYLDYEDCFNFFQKTRDWEQEYDNFFRNHKKIEILYKDLSRNTKAVIKIIQDFLGVPHEVLRTPLKKQIKLPLSETISNYWQLKEKFKNTQWIGFFED